VSLCWICHVGRFLPFFKENIFTLDLIKVFGKENHILIADVFWEIQQSVRTTTVTQQTKAVACHMRIKFKQLKNFNAEM